MTGKKKPDRRRQTPIKQTRNLFRERVGFYACTVPVFEQYVLAELLESGDYERHIRRSRRLLRKKRG